MFCNKIWLFMIYAVLSQNLFYLIYVLLREEKMNKLSLWRKLTNMRYMCMVFSVQRTESFKHMLISLSLILIVFEICLHSCWSAFYSWEQCFRAESPVKLRMLRFVLFTSRAVAGVGGSVCLEAIKPPPPASHSHRSSRACPLPRWPRAETARRRVSSSGGSLWEGAATNCSGTKIIRAPPNISPAAALSHEVVRQKLVFRNFGRQGLFVAKRNTNCEVWLLKLWVKSCQCIVCNSNPVLCYF